MGKAAGKVRLAEILNSPEEALDEVTTKADGPAGSLPLTDEMLQGLAIGRPVRLCPKTRAWAGRPPRSNRTTRI